MFDTLCSLVPLDPDYPPRTRVLNTLRRFLDGTLYDVLPHHFHEERGAAGNYIPLRQRRPSVRYNLSKTVVEDSVSLLFGEGHFPTINCSDPQVQIALLDIFRDAHLNQVMTDAALRGAVGSTAVLMRILKGKIFFEVLDTAYLTPVWDPANPDSLLRVTERYKASGRRLADIGFEVAEPDKQYWFQRQWDTAQESWFTPVPIEDQAVLPTLDLDRSVQHNLGFVPVVWIKNLPGMPTTGDPNDGACTFRAAIETQIEIEYQLSQAGRGLKYSSDPTLLIKEPAFTENQIVKGAGNALLVGENGDAKLLEIGGTASAAVIEYVRMLREFALESIHGNRAAADRLTAAQSGRALELMNQGLFWLAENLRVSYGETALLTLARMVICASNIYPLQAMGRTIPPLDAAAHLSIAWPRWYPSTADDRQKDAQALASLAQAGLLSKASAMKATAVVFDIEEADSGSETMPLDMNPEHANVR